MPPTALRLLQDVGSVALLDGDSHRHRKRMFMSLMTPERIEQLSDLMADRWHAYLSKWQERTNGIVLFDEVREILCAAACRWAGVPLAESEVASRTRQFGAMIDGSGSIGPRQWRGAALREKAERWIRGIVARAREEQLALPEGSAAHAITQHRDADGRLLDERVAAVELINILRPTVAVARYVTFAALALHQHAKYRERIAAGEDEWLEPFVQEVRRYYPFFPFVGGRAREEFVWRGNRFPKGRWVILDLYGTDHDERSWEEPGEFRPERFRSWDGSPYDFIPQGGGDHYTNHRCAGEWVTIELMKRATRLLTRSMRYEVPVQSFTIDLTRLPAVPTSRFVISNVKGAGSETQA
jgi:fatty-acid peroxygenase